MARQYASHPSAHKISDDQIQDARNKLSHAERELNEVQADDPLSPGWDQAYETAQIRQRQASRRLEALEAARAAQVERAGTRADAVKKNGTLFRNLAKTLTESRDLVAEAAQSHMDSTVKLVNAVDEHNNNLRNAREKLAELGLRVRDDLQETDHEQGAHERDGVRVDGTDWMLMPAEGIAAHALIRVFTTGKNPYHVFTQLAWKWRDYEITRRSDGLVMPEPTHVP